MSLAYYSKFSTKQFSTAVLRRVHKCTRYVRTQYAIAQYSTRSSDRPVIELGAPTFDEDPSLPECVILVKKFSRVQFCYFESFGWVRETIITNECFWYFYFFWDKMFTKRLLMSSNTPINLKIIRFRSTYRRSKFYFAHSVVSWLNHGFEQEKLFHSLYAHIHAKS